MLTQIDPVDTQINLSPAMRYCLTALVNELSSVIHCVPSFAAELREFLADVECMQANLGVETLLPGVHCARRRWS